MNGKRVVKWVWGLLLSLLLSNIAVKAQLPLPPDPDIQLDSWSFNDTNWLSDLGYPPLSFANLNNPPGFDGNALQVDSTNAAWLQYNIVELDGTTNLTFREGSIEFWILPDWNSGTGPGDWGRLIDVGAFSTNTSTSSDWWSLYVSPDGTSLNFSSETNGIFTNYLSVPINWDTNTWHLIDLTYFAHFRSELYVDGQLATNGPGVDYEPTAEAISNGFFVGSDNTGWAQSRALIDDLATFNYPLSEYEITNDYLAGLPLVAGGGFSPADGGGGLMPPGGGGGGTNTYQGLLYYPVYTTNSLWLQIVGTTNAITPNGTAGLIINSPWNVTNGVFDLFATTNLLSSTWQWLLRTAPGQTNLTATGLSGPNEFFVLGTMQPAADASGLTTAYENLVSNAFSSDGFGTPNAWYLQNNLNPQTPGIGTLDPVLNGLLDWQEYQYGTQPQVSAGFTIWVGTPNGTTSIP